MLPCHLNPNDARGSVAPHPAEVMHDGVRLAARLVTLLRGLSYTLLFAFATRGAAVFMLATAAIGTRSGVFPRWFALTGYLLGFVLLVAVSFFDWFILILPGWVAVVSLFILRRERARR